MNISVDFTSPVGTNSYFAPFQLFGYIVAHGGWVILLVAFLIGLWWSWIRWRKNLYDASIKFVLLAIDVPKENEQTPKAVENIFAHLHGIQKKGSKLERWVYGYNQQAFSLELISIGGYIQYLIRTPVQFRDLVEAAIYAQYPDAEITEVEDYTSRYKVEFPNDYYNVYGAELKLEKKEVYPIKTYIAFEDPSSREVFKDPMGSVLEILSRLKEGEEFWLQFVIAPPDDDSWREKGIKLIKKLIGAKESKKGNDLLWLPKNVIHGVSESFTASLIPPSDFPGASSSNGDVFKWPTMMQHLTPSERSVVEAIGIKISKIAFNTKIRMVYLARKEAYDHARIIPAVLGAIKQYNTMDLNGIKRDGKTKTKVTYPTIKSINEWRRNNRRRRIMWGYKYRSGTRGRNMFILNIEELASLFHFPISTVKAPLVKKTEAKKGEPPVSLPTDQSFFLRPKANPPSGPAAEDERQGPVAPGNLPFV